MTGHGSIPARHDQQQTRRCRQLVLLRYLDDIVAGKAVESIEPAWLQGRKRRPSTTTRRSCHGTCRPICADG